MTTECRGIEVEWGQGLSTMLGVLIIALIGIGFWAGEHGTFESSRFVWLAIAAILAAFLIIAGLGATGRSLGFLIDSRNRMTLARLQLILWTLAILPAYMTVALLRMGEHGLSAFNIVLPSELWWLLGISLTSTVGSPLLLSSKKHGAADPQEVIRSATEVARLEGRAISSEQKPGGAVAQGTVLRSAKPSEARVHNLFTGEETGNGGYLDIAKIQMFFFTIVLVIAYVLLLGKYFGTIIGSGEFPSPGDGMTQLLGFSHAGYLAHKAVPHSQRAGESTSMVISTAVSAVPTGASVPLENIEPEKKGK